MSSLFANKTAWFSQSVSKADREAWLQNGGKIVESPKQAEFCFSNDASLADTLPIAFPESGTGSIFFRSAFINDCAASGRFQDPGLFTLLPPGLQLNEKNELLIDGFEQRNEEPGRQESPLADGMLTQQVVSAAQVMAAEDEWDSQPFAPITYKAALAHEPERRSDKRQRGRADVIHEPRPTFAPAKKPNKRKAVATQQQASAVTSSKQLRATKPAASSPSPVVDPSEEPAIPKAKAVRTKASSLTKAAASKSAAKPAPKPRVEMVVDEDDIESSLSPPPHTHGTDETVPTVSNPTKALRLLKQAFSDLPFTQEPDAETAAEATSEEDAPLPPKRRKAAAGTTAPITKPRLPARLLTIRDFVPFPNPSAFLTFDPDDPRCEVSM
eukprot:TRINITY_DN6823_c0_g1_i1.p1 TRINITY_DN6823_c0_g1~~TRINITY_DN6823_c0_g1_i1.p1  ORF type:complete len:398 (-),score=73.94 TRINITY_DN6823_c0_g1_i1:982-2133(-)